MKWSKFTIRIVCWTGRVLALGLFLFWGAFFVEHLNEWFMFPMNGFPPVAVWLRQMAHLAILVGLVTLWRWPLTGSIVTILGSLGFFGSLAIWEGTAGKPNLLFLKFLAVTIIPALLTMACWFARNHALNTAEARLDRID
jgi:hypothetical protein